MTHAKDIVMPKERADFINRLLKLTGDEIYNIYGFKRDETISETVKFNDDIEIDIKLVICEGTEKPYTEAVIFKDGSEMNCTYPEDYFLGDWVLEYLDDTYVVTIIVVD